MKIGSIVFSALIFLMSGMVFGHGNGRLFDISVVDGKLIAQGFNSGSPDGLQPVRLHINAIHDHFNFIGSETEPLGVTNFPSWDIGILESSDISPLIGFDVTIQLVGSGKWVNIPEQDGTGIEQDFGTPEFVALLPDYLQNNPSEVIRVRYSGSEIDTLALGEFELLSNITGPTLDLDFEFFIDNHNASEIYFLEFVLKTNAPGVEDSDRVYVIQSPDGIGAVERLHFQSLYLESFLGTVVSSGVLLGDVNLDGQTDLLDVQPFVTLISGNVYQAEADTNQDGAVDLLDVNEFVAILGNG